MYFVAKAVRSNNTLHKRFHLLFTTGCHSSVEVSAEVWDGAKHEGQGDKCVHTVGIVSLHADYLLPIWYLLELGPLLVPTELVFSPILVDNELLIGIVQPYSSEELPVEHSHADVLDDSRLVNLDLFEVDCFGISRLDDRRAHIVGEHKLDSTERVFELLKLIVDR